MYTSEQLFRAAILEKTSQPLVVRRLHIPNLNFGQVLVKLSYSGICRSQIMEIKGLRGKDNFLPHLLGHEGVGSVVAVGPGVTKVNVGDKIVISWIKSDGISSENPTYFDENGLKVNAGAATTFNELAVVSENRISLKPDSLRDELAPLFGCAFLTGMGMALKEAEIDSHRTVMIYGLGGIGLGALIGARSKNPRKLIVVDASHQKRCAALKLGVDYVLDNNSLSFQRQLDLITENRGVDICLEAAGSVNSIESAFKFVAKDGLLIFASHPNASDRITLNPIDLISGKRIKGTWGGATNPDTDMETFAQVLVKSNINLDILNFKIYTLDDINDAIADLEDGNVMRPIINLN